MGSCIWQCATLAKSPSVNSRVRGDRGQKVKRKGGRERKWEGWNRGGKKREREDKEEESVAGRNLGGGPAEHGWSTSGEGVGGGLARCGWRTSRARVEDYRGEVAAAGLIWA